MELSNVQCKGKVPAGNKTRPCRKFLKKSVLARMPHARLCYECHRTLEARRRKLTTMKGARAA